MNITVFIAITIGLIGGAFLGYVSSKALALKLSKLSSSPRIVLTCATVGTLVVLLPAFFISFVVGGNLGGSWAEATTTALGLGSVGVPVGLAIGIAVVLGAGLAAGAFLGAMFGKVLSHVLAK